MKEPQHWARLLTFDPSMGIVIREPPGAGAGHWVGAPGVMYDSTDGTFYLLYRVRRPRGVPADRGAELHLAHSSDGIHFETIWMGTKDQLNSTSMERCAMRRLGKDRWILYVSYVDPADGRWRIDQVQAAHPASFELKYSSPLLTSADIHAEGVKDPFLFQVAGLYHMIVSFATAPQPATPDQLHSTHDAYNTGLIRSASGLATSEDGIHWTWEGEIFGPSQSDWDKYCSRIGTVWRQDGVWLALYDGSADVSENYEERVGLAFSHDLRQFRRVTMAAPLMLAPTRNTALRYFDVLSFRESTFFYYEMARPDGSHDLRVFHQRQ